MESSKFKIFVQARMSSSRLPGKVLAIANGRPLIGHLFERLKLCKEPSEAVLVTSTEPEDNELVQFAKNEDIKFFCGPLNNVAKRMLLAAREYNADYFVRINGDSPLIDYRIVDKAIKISRENLGVDLVTNVAKRSYPRGQSVEVVKRDALQKIVNNLPNEITKEHVTTDFYQKESNFKIINFSYETDLSTIQMSVDTMEDFVTYCQLLQSIGENIKTAQFVDILYHLNKLK